MKRVNFHMATQLTSLVSEVTDLKPGCEEGKTEILNWEITDFCIVGYIFYSISHRNVCKYEQF